MIKLILPLVLILGIIGGVYLVQNRVNLFPKADEIPFQEKVTISNIAPTSFAISYFTKAPSYDFIQYGEDTAVPTVALDRRSKNGLNPQLSTHYFLLKDLKPDTKYFFKINSNGILLPEDSLDAAASSAYLTAKTPVAIPGTPGTEIYGGTVKKIGTGQAPAEAIVFLSSENGQLLSAPMKDSGEWTIGFSGMRSADLSKYLPLSGTDQIKFLAYAARDGFGLFGEYALKKSGINIEVDEGRIPFYKIDVTQPEGGDTGNDNNRGGNVFWITVQDFLKGVF